MKHWIWGLSAVALTACSSGGGGDDGDSSSASRAPDPVPAYIAYDTDTLDVINAPAAAQGVRAPALSDPDTIAIIDTAFNLNHSEYTGNVLEYFDGVSAIEDPYYDNVEEPVPGFRNHGTAVASIAAGQHVGVRPIAV